MHVEKAEGDQKAGHTQINTCSNLPGAPVPSGPQPPQGPAAGTFRVRVAKAGADDQECVLGR